MRQYDFLVSEIIFLQHCYEKVLFNERISVFININQNSYSQFLPSVPVLLTRRLLIVAKQWNIQSELIGDGYRVIFRILLVNLLGLPVAKI